MDRPVVTTQSSSPAHHPEYDSSVPRSTNFQVPQGNFAIAGSTSSLVVIPYAETLLVKAKELIVQGDFSIAVVVTHMACEISVERALSQAFKVKGIEHIAESILAFSSGYNLSNKKIRNLYNVLTEKQIQNEHFWSDFNKSVTRRNGAVHRGEIITKADAEASYDAASALIGYLQQN